MAQAHIAAIIKPLKMFYKHICRCLETELEIMCIPSIYQTSQSKEMLH